MPLIASSRKAAGLAAGITPPATRMMYDPIYFLPYRYSLRPLM